MSEFDLYIVREMCGRRQWVENCLKMKTVYCARNSPGLSVITIIIVKNKRN